MPLTPQAFITRHTDEVRPLNRNVALAYWDASLSGKPEDFEKVAALEKQLVAIYSRTDEFAEVRALHEDLTESDDPLVARQIDMLFRSYKGCQGDRDLLNRIVDLENDLAREFNTFRADFRGRKRSNNDLEQILKTTRKSDEARETWEALKQIGAVAAPRVSELAHLRNRHAQSLGSPNYYIFSLELGELRQDKLFALLSDLKERTDPLFARLKGDLDARLAGEFGIPETDLKPWHYRNAFFQEMPEEKSFDLDPIFAGRDLEALTKRYYDGIGLDIQSVLDSSDLYEREGKDQHAYCIGIDNPTDVRVLCNVKSTGRWMSTMLHEFGHAVYDCYVDPDLPYLLRNPAHTLSTEAIAMLNERFLQSAEFLSGIADVEPGRAREIEAGLASHQAHKMLVFVRWVLVMTHFERAMYEDPDQDLNALWWENVERFQSLDGSERCACPDWASKLHLAGAPVYYQNYLLGEMNASQILAAMRRAAGSDGRIVGNPKVGAFLRQAILAPGATKPWNERLAEATGEPLNPRFFLADLGGIEAV